MPLWGARIVVVDDDAEHMDLLTLLLGRAGAEVIPVSHPGQAIATIAGVLPDLAVVDVAMPGLDGLTLWRKVRTLSPEKGGRIPAVVLTAGPICAGSRLEWKHAGFQACMSKPFLPDLFLDVADRLTGTSVERRQADAIVRVVGLDVERRREQRATTCCAGFEVIAGVDARRAP